VRCRAGGVIATAGNRKKESREDSEERATHAALLSQRFGGG
jgi:hypothetical protein